MGTLKGSRLDMKWSDQIDLQETHLASGSPMQYRRPHDLNDRMGVLCQRPFSGHVNGSHRYGFFQLEGRESSWGRLEKWYNSTCSRCILAITLKPQQPEYDEGMRIDPPISDPIPMREPRDPIIAPSPPEDPPQVREELWGFVVVPAESTLLQSNYNCVIWSAFSLTINRVTRHVCHTRRWDICLTEWNHSCKEFDNNNCLWRIAYPLVWAS